MRRLLLIAIAIVAAAGLSAITVALPIAGVGVLATFVVAGAATMVPERHLVGVLGSVSVTMLMVFPVHLVPNFVRYGELLVLAVFTVVVMLRRRAVGVLPAGPLLLLGYLALTIMSSVQYGVSDSVFQVLTSHTIVAVTFLVFGLKGSPSERRTIAGVFIVVAALEAAYGLVEIVARPPVLWASPVPVDFVWTESRLPNEIIPGVLRAQGSFGHPLLFVFALLIAMAFTRDFPLRNNIVRDSLTVLFIAGAIAAGSRSATLIMIGVLLFSLGSRSFRVLRGIGVGIVVAGVAVFSGFFDSAVVARFTESGSLTHRQGIWGNIPSLLSQSFERQLIGSGWIRVEDVYAQQILPATDGFHAIDNQLIATFITSGWLGLGLFVAAVIVSIAHGRGPVRLALVAGAGMFFVFDVLEFPATWSLLALLIGFAATTSGGDITRADRAPRSEASELSPERVLP